jgi:peptide/nickel transport system permease protein
VKYLKLLFKSPWFCIGVIMFFTCILAGLLYPLFLHADPFVRGGIPFEPPSAGHWLGTNNEGQDMFARLLVGLRSSLFVGVAAGIFATLLGTFIGIVGGYKGGVIDNALTLITNLFMVIPSILVLILIANSIDKRSMLLVAFIIGATTWPWTARAVSAQTSSLKNREHVSLAKLNGYGVVSILIMQILPYIMSYVFMVFIIQMATGILEEAAISMMGLGPYDSVTLGQIINQAQKTEAFTNGNWWVFMPATLLITALQFSLYIVNTSMEGIFNPRLRKEE